MQKVADGLYSQAMMQAIKMADGMQARAVLGIKKGFATREERMVEIDNLTYEQFMKILNAADRNGRREELEAELSQIMLGAMQTIIAQEQAAGQQQGGG